MLIKHNGCSIRDSGLCALLYVIKSLTRQESDNLVICLAARFNTVSSGRLWQAPGTKVARKLTQLDAAGFRILLTCTQPLDTQPTPK